EDGKDRKVILEALDSAPSSDELTLVQRHEQAMQRLIRQVRDAVAGSDHPTIYADVTGGMKPHSIALYRAAERELATVTYVVFVNEKPDSLMVLAEPEVLSKNREEVG